MSQEAAAMTAEGPSTAIREHLPRSRRKTVFYEPEVPAKKEAFRVPKACTSNNRRLAELFDVQGAGTRLRDIPASKGFCLVCVT